MSSFALPRVALAATLRLSAGGERKGQVFLMERVPQHSGLETPLEMLNRDETFFPFRPDGRDPILLVAKAHTVWLAVAPGRDGEDPARASAATRIALDLTIADGAHLIGVAAVEMPKHHSRLLDYLNASASPFFAVITAQGTHFVNRAHVLYAQPEN